MGRQTISDETRRDGADLHPLDAHIVTIDCLAVSFPILAGESQWLMQLLAGDLARILGDD